MPTLSLVYDARSTTKSGQFMNRAVVGVVAKVLSCLADDEACNATLMTTVGGDSFVILDPDQTVECRALGFHLVVGEMKSRMSELQSCTLRILSTDKTTAGILEFVKGVVASSATSLNSTRYIYDSRPCASAAGQRSREFVNQTPEHIARIQRIVSAPRAIAFQRHPFQSTKTFDNLVGDTVRELRRRVEFFLGNREWYAKKGIPYQLGIMLSGDCGTGKSSAIRALANATARSIVNINLTNIATTGQLKRLFLNESINVFESDEQSEPTVVTLPIDERIFVLDEVDAVGASVVSRTSQQMEPDELSLGDLLNIFDGGVEVPGRVVVMLCNHPERLDPALVRPGRIDIHIRFSAASRKDVAELFALYFSGGSILPAASEDAFAAVPDGVLSPAEISDVFISAAASGVEADPAEICGILCIAAEAKKMSLASSAAASL